ncbi:MAG: hypothetical protein KAI79_01380 [Bacteroidales bacterium]|nr:hypothetical protein [Bacteroidales bacterium]
MNKDRTNNKLRFTYNQLIEYSVILLSNLHRDTIMFEKFGIKEKQKIEFEKKINALKKLPSNQELMKGRSLVTKRKKAIIIILKNNIRDIQLRVQLAFGKYSEKYKNIKAKNIANLIEEELIETADRYISFAENNAEALMNFGFTKNNYQEIKNTLSKLNNAIFDYNILEERRKKYSEKRKQLAESLYDTLVSYSHVGKTYWTQYGNELKYKEYVLYPNQKTKEKEKETQD